MIGSLLAWTVGVVLAGWQPQRIYEDPEDHDPANAECRQADGGLRCVLVGLWLLKSA
ncbi:cyanate permease [Salmonella enterica subsp. enterica serovar Goldcoast]|nr:cyanate permease [Salmonella enterica subsp. enterica serovar Goldcoast]